MPSVRASQFSGGTNVVVRGPRLSVSPGLTVDVGVGVGVGSSSLLVGMVVWRLFLIMVCWVVGTMAL